MPDVHDLFVTEPEAVEEWQVAAADAWTVSEMEPGFDAEPVPEPSPAVAPAPVEAQVEEWPAVNEWSALVAPEFPAGPEAVLTQSFPAALESPAYDLEPVGFAAEPVTFEVVGPTYEPESVPFESQPVSFESPAYDLDPEAQGEVPVTFDLAPVAEPVAESFAWSPWAQEMGLGEAPVVPAAAAEPFPASGFADMVEDAGGHGHTDAFPVPQAPVANVEEGSYPVVELTPDYPVVDEVAQFVPQPRDPGDSVGDPTAYAEVVGAHAADAEYATAQEAAEVSAVAGAPEAQVESAPDPLAGGLLAHLMSSVRGL